MQIVDAEGTSGEIGRVIGTALAGTVHAAVEAICGRIDWHDELTIRRLDDVSELLKRRLPHVLAEAEGLSEGAGISLRDALGLSIASDLTGKLPAYCSLIALDAPPGVLLAKNLDSRPEMQHLQVLERITPSDGFAYVHLTTAGAMWTDGGVNEAGLGLVDASLNPMTDNPIGVPDGIAVREVLRRCSTVSEAVEVAGELPPRTLGENLLVADASGQAARLELLPDGMAVATGIPLACCNHPLDERLARSMAPDDPIAGNSRRRFSLLVERLFTSTTNSAHSAAIELLETVAQSGEDDLWTVTSLVVRTDTRSLWALDGGPRGRTVGPVSSPRSTGGGPCTLACDGGISVDSV